VAPDEVIARIAAEKSGAGVESVARDARASRLLVVRVGPAWTRLAPARRLALADAWRHLWRDAVPRGIVAVLDAATGRALVNFDATGRARMPAARGEGRPPALSGGPR
jgi:hypothetical protein